MNCKPRQKRIVKGFVARPARALFPVLLLSMAGQNAFATQGEHLLLSEIAYDTTYESKPLSAEYIELVNPTHEDITLNSGAVPGLANGLGSYFITDEHDQYFNVVNGIVNNGTSSDAILQFPVDAVIPAHSIVVITANSDTFLEEFFGGSLDAFKAQPGSPQLFESLQDGSDDGVPDMVPASSNVDLSLTNGGESMTIFYWDGESDLIQDIDSVCWADLDDLPDKDSHASAGIDGPDADDIISFYADDAGTMVPAGDARGGTTSLQRTGKLEPSELLTGGNGSAGHDETSEDVGSAFVTTTMTPGRFLIQTDGDLGDILTGLPPVAVSATDGSSGEASPLDYGSDGALTELFATTLDRDADREADTLYVALRGELFGASDGDTNATIILIDTDPSQPNGYRTLNGSGNTLSDTTGNLDTRITEAGFSLDGNFDAGGFDAAVGLDLGSLSDFGDGGWRSFGSADLPGTPANFAYLGSTDDIRFQGDINVEVYPAAPGATIAGPDGFEASLLLESLEGPDYIRIVAVTTADDGAYPSPNTLPESASDSFDAPHIIDSAICLQTETGKVVTYYSDNDGDGYGDAVSTYCGPPGADGVSLDGGDCNDSNQQVKPSTTEECNGIDDDCDSLIDDADDDIEGQDLWYLDSDTDGYGDSNNQLAACSAPEGYEANALDCDDSNGDINPDAAEICDGLDNNCNGSSDDDDDGISGQSTWYADNDQDSFGDPTNSSVNCFQPEGYLAENTDCDDSAQAINPEATEICDGVDNNCNDAIDDSDDGISDQESWYEDLDGDGHGNADSEVLSCEQPDGYVSSNEDCDDEDDKNYPGNLESCDLKDNDCDGGIDDLDPEGPANPMVFFADGDGDGIGDPSQSTMSCVAAEGYVSQYGDCDDTNADIYPNAAELCDGLDNNCDGAIPAVELTDQDEDSFVLCDDCDDNNSNTYPGASELCDGLDNDCDDVVPDGEKDADDDAFLACEDCDDSNSDIHPGATEVCDQLDNDCDELSDEGFDADADGYFDPIQCDFGDDCDDSRDDIFPGATESCDTVDNDCDDIVDENKDTDGDGVSSCSDCDDNDIQSYPGAEELCDGLDNDCDGLVPFDEQDGDLDGFVECGLEGPEDCDDTNAAIFPGAEELCDGFDNDCLEGSQEDVDGDGDGLSICDGDCNDGDSNISPDLAEACDGLDTDCDPETSELDDNDEDGQSACENDCDDREETVYGEFDGFPAAPILCDGLDNACSGTLPDDEVDLDEDGFFACEECDDEDADLFPNEDPEMLCSDGEDNDCDTFTDLEDEDCTPTPTETPAPTDTATPTLEASTDPTPSGQTPAEFTATQTLDTPTTTLLNTETEVATATETVSEEPTATQAPTTTPTAETLAPTGTDNQATPSEGATASNDPTATMGGGDDGGCDCKHSPDERPANGALALFAILSIAALRRRR